MAVARQRGKRGDHVVGCDPGRQPRRCDVGTFPAETIDRLAPERRNEEAPGLGAATQCVGHHRGDVVGRVEVGLVRVVLDLDVDPHSPARVECLVERRNLGGKFHACRSHNHRTVDHMGVVMNDETPVGAAPHVEFDRIGTHLGGPQKGRHGVLPFGPGRPTMGHDRTPTAQPGGNLGGPGRAAGTSWHKSHRSPCHWSIDGVVSPTPWRRALGCCLHVTCH